MTMAGNNITDSIERAEALDPSRSFIVQAPAGSGKTELLMQRYLVLLSMVEKPEEILALTFTKKAAGEMQNRITGALIRAWKGVVPDEPHEAKTVALAGEVLKRDAVLGWGLLQNPGRLKVQTIDSLSAGLVRQMPLISRLGKQPAISEAPEELYAEAAELTVELVDDDGPDGDSVRGALEHLDNSTRALTERLVIMLSRRDQWKSHVEMKKRADLKGLLEGSLRNLVSGELERLRAAFPERLSGRLVSLARYAACNLEKGPIKALEEMEAVPYASPEDLPLWQGVSALLLKKEKPAAWRKPGGVNAVIGFPADKDPGAMGAKKDFKELLTELDGESGFLEELSNARDLPAPVYDAEEWEILSSLLHLLPVAKRILEGVFRREGVVDFQEVSMAALKALGEEDAPTDLMLSLDLKVRHILVDEYQDTSRGQLALLTSLTRGWTEGDGRTLFIVGDPMQSIYLFREAEVGLFLKARLKGVGGIPLRPLTLKSNFRSAPALIDWVNGAFNAAFPAIEDPFLGSISYSPSDAVKKGGSTGPEVVLFEKRDDRLEARRVVEIIKEVPRGESAAVLCRSRAHLLETVEVLKGEGVEFRAEEFDPLSQRAVVQDLLTLLRVLSHPYDRVAWLSALRAPWCALTVGDLHRIASGDKTAPVLSLIEDSSRLSSLSEDGRLRLERFTGILKKALERNGRVPQRDLLEGLWVSLGGPACVPDDSGMEDAEEFFGLVESASARGRNISLKTLEQRISRLYASHGGQAGTVLDLMTVHKAKGLEFDHVIIPGLGKPTRGAEKKLLLWMERGEDLLLAPVERKLGDRESLLYRYLTLINRRKDELETTRLLYVAATRAKKGLYLLGHIDGTDDEGGLKVRGRSFLSTIRTALSPTMVAAAPDEKDGAPEAGRPPFKRLPLTWKAPSPAPPAAVDTEPEGVAGLSGEPEYYWAGETARHIGTVVHRYLCRIAREGLGGWSSERPLAESDRVRAALKACGLSGGNLDEAVSKAVTAVSKALKDPRGRWALDAHREGSVELPLTGVLGGEIVHAVIDRTFVEDGVRWVIDYKTGTHEGGGLKEFLESEKLRYSPQLERYASVLRAAGEGREIKKGLYYPVLSEWVEL